MTLATQFSLTTMEWLEALFTRVNTDIWTEIRPVKVLHCVNGDGPKFRQNGCGIHSSRISAWISITPYVAVLKLYWAEFKINSVLVRVNKAWEWSCNPYLTSLWPMRAVSQASSQRWRYIKWPYVTLTLRYLSQNKKLYVETIRKRQKWTKTAHWTIFFNLTNEKKTNLQKF